MATRRPDGLDLGANPETITGRRQTTATWERDKGDPAARPAGDARGLAHAIRAGESFPYLSEAVKGKGDEDIVQILNFSLRGHVYDSHDRIEDGKVVKLLKPVRVKMRPFEVREVSVRTAKLLVRRNERPAHRHSPLTVIILHGKAGDCERARNFIYNGQTFQSCPFEKCTQHGHAAKPWSIHRAQQFLITLRTPAAIQRFVESFDTRPEVALFATAEIRAREAAIQRNRLGGMQPSTHNDAVV